APRWARSCGARLACGTRIGIPRCLPVAGPAAAGPIAAAPVGPAPVGPAPVGPAPVGSGAGSHGARATDPAPATGSDGGDESDGGACASDGIVIGPVSQGAIGHSRSPARGSVPGPAATAGSSRCRPVSARGPPP